MALRAWCDLRLRVRVLLIFFTGNIFLLQKLKKRANPAAADACRQFDAGSDMDSNSLDSRQENTKNE
jgi:hypothetical protein